MAEENVIDPENDPNAELRRRALEVQQQRAKEAERQSILDLGDFESGASLKSRLAVSSYDTPERREQVVKKFYPIYKRAEDIFNTTLPEYSKYKDNYFVYDEGDKKWKLFDPLHAEKGDWADVALTLGEMVGGGIGGIVGAPSIVGSAVTGAGGAVIADSAGNMLADALQPGEPVSRGGFLEEVSDAGINAAIDTAAGVGMDVATRGMGKGLKSLGGWLVRKAIGDKGIETGQETAEMADHLGLEIPTLGVLTGDKNLMGLEQRLAQTPNVRDIMEQRKDKFISGAERALGIVSDDIAKDSKNWVEDAGHLEERWNLPATIETQTRSVDPDDIIMPDGTIHTKDGAVITPAPAKKTGIADQTGLQSSDQVNQADQADLGIQPEDAYKDDLNKSISEVQKDMDLMDQEITARELNDMQAQNFSNPPDLPYKLKKAIDYEDTRKWDVLDENGKETGWWIEENEDIGEKGSMVINNYDLSNNDVPLQDWQIIDNLSYSGGNAIERAQAIISYYLTDSNLNNPNIIDQENLQGLNKFYDEFEGAGESAAVRKTAQTGTETPAKSPYEQDIEKMKSMDIEGLKDTGDYIQNRVKSGDLPQLNNLYGGGDNPATIFEYNDGKFQVIIRDPDNPETILYDKLVDNEDDAFLMVRKFMTENGTGEFLLTKGSNDDALRDEVNKQFTFNNPGFSVRNINLGDYKASLENQARKAEEELISNTPGFEGRYPPNDQKYALDSFNVVRKRYGLKELTPEETYEHLQKIKDIDRLDLETAENYLMNDFTPEERNRLLELAVKGEKMPVKPRKKVDKNIADKINSNKVLKGKMKHINAVLATGLDIDDVRNVKTIIDSMSDDEIFFISQIPESEISADVQAGMKASDQVKKYQEKYGDAAQKMKAGIEENKVSPELQDLFDLADKHKIEEINEIFGMVENKGEFNALEIANMLNLKYGSGWNTKEVGQIFDYINDELKKHTDGDFSYGVMEDAFTALKYKINPNKAVQFAKIDPDPNDDSFEKFDVYHIYEKGADTYNFVSVDKNTGEAQLNILSESDTDEGVFNFKTLEEAKKYYEDNFTDVNLRNVDIQQSDGSDLESQRAKFGNLNDILNNKDAPEDPNIASNKDVGLDDSDLDSASAFAGQFQQDMPDELRLPKTKEERVKKFGNNISQYLNSRMINDEIPRVKNAYMQGQEEKGIAIVAELDDGVFHVVFLKDADGRGDERLFTNERDAFKYANDELYNAGIWSKLGHLEKSDRIRDGLNEQLYEATKQVFDRKDAIMKGTDDIPDEMLSDLNLGLDSTIIKGKDGQEIDLNKLFKDSNDRRAGKTIDGEGVGLDDADKLDKMPQAIDAVKSKLNGIDFENITGDADHISGIEELRKLTDEDIIELFGRKNDLDFNPDRFYQQARENIRNNGGEDTLRNIFENDDLHDSLELFYKNAEKLGLTEDEMVSVIKYGDPNNYWKNVDAKVNDDGVIEIRSKNQTKTPASAKILNHDLKKSSEWRSVYEDNMEFAMRYHDGNYKKQLMEENPDIFNKENYDLYEIQHPYYPNVSFFIAEDLDAGLDKKGVFILQEDENGWAVVADGFETPYDAFNDIVKTAKIDKDKIFKEAGIETPNQDDLGIDTPDTDNIGLNQADEVSTNQDGTFNASFSSKENAVEFVSKNYDNLTPDKIAEAFGVSPEKVELAKDKVNGMIMLNSNNWAKDAGEFLKKNFGYLPELSDIFGDMQGTGKDSLKELVKLARENKNTKETFIDRFNQILDNSDFPNIKQEYIDDYANAIYRLSELPDSTINEMGYMDWTNFNYGYGYDDAGKVIEDGIGDEIGEGVLDPDPDINKALKDANMTPEDLMKEQIIDANASQTADDASEIGITADDIAKGASTEEPPHPVEKEEINDIMEKYEVRAPTPGSKNTLDNKNKIIDTYLEAPDKFTQQDIHRVNKIYGGVSSNNKETDNLFNALFGNQGIPTPAGTSKEGKGIGEIILSGAETWKRQVRNATSAMYDRVEKYTNKMTAFSDLKHVKELKQKIEDEIKASRRGLTPARKTTLDRIDDYIADMEENRKTTRKGMPFETVKKNRTDIIRQYDLSGDSLGNKSTKDEHLKRLKDALTKDMEDALKKPGNEQAYEMWKNANSYRARRVDKIDKIIDKIQGQGSPEQVFNLLKLGTKEGDTTLRQIRDNLPAETWDLVRASLLDRMGFASSGAPGEVFSPAKFLTAWGAKGNNRQYSDSAKDLLFGTKDKPYRQNLDRLVAIFKQIERMGEEKNYSLTGNTIMYAAVLSPFLIGAGTATNQALQGNFEGALRNLAGGAMLSGGMAMGSRSALRFLIDHDTMQWIIKQGEMPYKKAGQTGIRARLAQLATIADRNPDISVPIYEYLNAVGNNLRLLNLDQSQEIKTSEDLERELLSIDPEELDSFLESSNIQQKEKGEEDWNLFKTQP